MFVGFPLLMAVVMTSVLSLAVLVLLGLPALVMGYKRGRSAYWAGVLRKGTPETVADDAPTQWAMGGTPRRLR